MVEKSRTPPHPQLLDHKHHTIYMEHSVRWIMLPQCLNLSLIHRHYLHQLHSLQQLPRVLTVNLPGLRSLMTRPSLGTFNLPCLLGHLVICLIMDLTGWAWQQIRREALLSLKMQRRNSHSHQLAQVCRLHMSCSIILIHHCLLDSSQQMDHRHTHLVWHQMLFHIHFWTMGTLRHRLCHLKEIYYQTAQAMVPLVTGVISHHKAAQTMIADYKNLNSSFQRFNIF